MQKIFFNGYRIWVGDYLRWGKAQSRKGKITWLYVGLGWIMDAYYIITREGRRGGRMGGGRVSRRRERETETGRKLGREDIKEEKRKERRKGSKLMKYCSKPWHCSKTEFSQQTLRTLQNIAS